MRLTNINLIKFIGLPLMFGFLMACSAEKLPVNEQRTIAWPAAPAKAKVRFVSSFSNPDDLGIERGFFQWVSDLFTGEESFQLIRPMSVVVTAKNQIYVADPGSKGVHRFDLQAKEYRLITRENELVLSSPVALSLGPDDSVFVVDSDLAQVFKISSKAEHAVRVLTSVEFKQPTGIAFDPEQKRIYISDTANHQIKIINAQGELEKSFGQRGERAGEFNYPTYLWFDQYRRLIVTDSLNFRVQVFDSKGEYIYKFGRLGNASGNLSRPKGIAVDKRGYIYIVDALFNAVQIFNDKGALMLPFGNQGQEPGQFWLPAGIFLNNNDEIYIADSHNQRVQILRYVGGNE